MPEQIPNPYRIYPQSLFYLLLIPVHFWYCHQTSAITRIFREYPILLISDSFLLILTQGLFIVKQIKKMMNIIFCYVIIKKV